MSRSAVIVVSSHVVRGTVGNRAAALALETLGHPVWSVATVTLPWHPGQNAVAGLGTRLVPDGAGFKALLEDIAGAPWLGEVGAVLTGYLGAPAQVAPTAALVDAVKAANPSAIYAMDPVMGDEGRLYVPEEQASAMRERLLPHADLVTPNAFELGWLTGKGTATTSDALIEQARLTGVERVCITSAPGRHDDEIANLSVETGKIMRATTPRLPSAPNGAGDLTSALLLSSLLTSGDMQIALRQTTASVFDVLSDTLAAGADELVLEHASDVLRHPRADVRLERL